MFLSEGYAFYLCLSYTSLPGNRKGRGFTLDGMAARLVVEPAIVTLSCRSWPLLRRELLPIP
jgi:hypothetical protein